MNQHFGSRRRPALVYSTPIPSPPPAVESTPYPRPIIIPHGRSRKPAPSYSSFGVADAEQVRGPANGRAMVVATSPRLGWRFQSWRPNLTATRYAPPPVVEHDPRPRVLVVGRDARPGDRASNVGPRASSTRYVAPAVVEHAPLPRVVVAVRNPRLGDRVRNPAVFRPEYAPPPPPPTPTPPIPKTWVVPTTSLAAMAWGRARVPIRLATTPSNTSPTSSATALFRVVAVRRPPALGPQPASRVVVARTVDTTGGEPPPHNGGGGSPRPLQCSWIAGAVIPRHPRPTPAPVAVRTRYVQPSKDGLPNQVSVVAPRRVVKPFPGIVVHPTFKWGVNLGKTPNAPLVARRPVGIRVPAPIVVSSPPTSGLGFVPPNAAVVARVPAARRSPSRAAATRLVETPERIRPSDLIVPRPAPGRASPRIVVASTTATFAVRPILPAPPIIVPYSRTKRPRGPLTTSWLADAFEIAPTSASAPHVVPRPPRPSDRRRPPLVVASRPTFNPRSVPAFDPVVAARPVAAKASPWFFISNAIARVPPPPPRHDPAPRTLAVPVPRMRSPLAWPRPIATTSILQPDDERHDKPWDLIAACIARLRSDARIVAAYGDDPGSETGCKFVSDVELPGTAPPYAVFSEPTEFERYQSRDGAGRIDSTVEGVFHLTVYGGEKLAVRRLADMTAASLHDAPLVFVDGALMYLRRSERRFPVVSASGPGPDVAAFKRIVEFTYMIERFV